MIKERKKKILLAYSGGMDSTCLLWRNLRDGHEMRTLYVSQGDFNQQIVEKQIIKNCKAQLEKEHLFFEHHNAEFAFEDTHLHPFNITLPQLYLTFLSFYVSDIDEVQMAYVLNDCAVSWQNEMIEFWNKFSLFNSDTKPMPPLTFPLLKTSKDMIYTEVHALQRKSKKKLYWFCEHPEKVKGIENAYRECGECPSCKRMREIDPGRFERRDEDETKYERRDTKKRNHRFKHRRCCSNYIQQSSDYVISMGGGNSPDNLK